MVDICPKEYKDRSIKVGNQFDLDPIKNQLALPGSIKIAEIVLLQRFYFATQNFEKPGLYVEITAVLDLKLAHF